MSKPTAAQLAALKLAPECINECQVHGDGDAYSCRPRSCVRFVEMRPPQEITDAGRAELARARKEGTE